MTNAMTSPLTTETRWKAFDQSMCDVLNENPDRWLCIVGDSATAQHVMPHVDRACQRLSTSPAAMSSTFLKNLPTALAVTFTSPKHRMMGEDCLAAHGRTPFLAVVDFSNEDDQYSFILPLQSEEIAQQHQQPQQPTHETNDLSSTQFVVKASSSSAGTHDEAPHDGVPSESEPLSDAIEVFLSRVASGAEPRAPQGLRPTVGNLCPPAHGTLLVKCRSAVAGNIDSLVHNPHDPLCGTVAVFWSDRCPCCPGAVMMVEALVDLIDRVAADHHAKSHGPRQAEHTPHHTQQGDSAGAAQVRAVPCRRLHYISCNIDDNDYPNFHWPRDEAHQIVPTIVVYRPGRPTTPRRGQSSSGLSQQSVPPKQARTENTNATPNRKDSAREALPALWRVRFNGSRTPEELVAFLCRECLPEDCECSRHITHAATTIARALSGEELMRCLDPDDPIAQLAEDTFERLNGAYHELLASSITENRDATLRAKSEAWTDEVAGAYTAARRKLVDMEELTRRALARLEDSHLAAAAAAAVGEEDQDRETNPSKDGKPSADQSCCCAYRPAFLSSKKSSANTSAGPASPLPETNAGHAVAVSKRFLVEATPQDRREGTSPSSGPARSPPPQKRGREDSIADAMNLILPEVKK